MSFIYLDYNATTPVRPEVFEAMGVHLTEVYGNPSSPHIQGVEAKKAVEKARTQVASLLGCEADEVVFTSGGSESNNYAIKGAAHALRDKGNHIITSSIEHPAVEQVCIYLEGEGFEVTRLPVDLHGLINPEEAAAAMKAGTILISIMHANNEVGTIEPIAALARDAAERGVLIHTDAAQTVGKFPFRVSDLGVDLLSVAGHKLYAPKGVGALYVRKGVKLTPLIHGASHEAGRRAGTENTAAVVALGCACALQEKEEVENTNHMGQLRDRLHARLREAMPEAELNGHPEYRLPNTLSLSFPGVRAPDIIRALPEVAVSAGAACHAEGVTASHVLAAMGLSLDRALGTIRFSTGHFTTEGEIDEAADRIIRALKAIKAQ